MWENQIPMSTVKRPENLTLGHELAFLYLNLGYITDGELSKEEIETTIEKIGEWYEDGDGEDLHTAINETIQWTKSCGDDLGSEIGECARRLKNGLEEKNLRAIMGDMAAIINADGKVVGGEVKYFHLVAEIFGIELN